MNQTAIINALARNRQVFKHLLSDLPKETYMWKPSADKWCLLEIVCHLYDEEREDFRARVKHVLETPEKSFPPFDPIGMVKTRNYIKQNYHEMVVNFLSERTLSVDWLAHDYLHIRQITRLKYQFLQSQSGEDLSYAGAW